jgi:anti-sigma B factor antagonist
MADLRIETRLEGERAELLLLGEFDLAGIERFREALAKVEQGDPNVIVIDLDGLEFMDSSGLRALIVADDRARDAQRRLAIVPGPAQIRRVFEITQIEQRLDLVEDGSQV